MGGKRSAEHKQKMVLRDGKRFTNELSTLAADGNTQAEHEGELLGLWHREQPRDDFDDWLQFILDGKARKLSQGLHEINNDLGGCKSIDGTSSEVVLESVERA